MKKLVSVLLAFVMMASVCCVSAFAEEPPAGKFYERFVEQYGEAMYYQEVQPHYDENNEIDWVVVFACTEMALVEPLPDDSSTRHYVNGEFTFHKKDLYFPFEVGHCVYDVKKDEFIDITKVNFSKYADLKEHVRTYNFANLIGDIDNDNDVTIMDATEIQFIMASLKELSVCTCTADFDRDGFITILDATAIQLKLAGLDKPVANDEMVYSEFNNMYGVDTGIEEVAFETLYNSYYDVESKINGERYAVIIKSKEQLDSAFYSYVDLESVLNDEFFEDKWLVVSACRVTDSEMNAEISYLGIRYKTLFMRADRELRDTDGIAEPIAPMYYSFVAVDKDVLAQVTEIIWL